jgi:hypothetical protein
MNVPFLRVVFVGIGIIAAVAAGSCILKGKHRLAVAGAAAAVANPVAFWLTKIFMTVEDNPDLNINYPTTIAAVAGMVMAVFVLPPVVIAALPPEHRKPTKARFVVRSVVAAVVGLGLIGLLIVGTVIGYAYEMSIDWGVLIEGITLFGIPAAGLLARSLRLALRASEGDPSIRTEPTQAHNRRTTPAGRPRDKKHSRP